MLLEGEGIEVRLRQGRRGEGPAEGAIPCIEVASTASSAENLKIASAARLASSPYLGPIILMSFECKQVVARQVGGAVLDTPGVHFIRMPTTRADFIKTLRAPAPPHAVCFDAIPRIRRAAAIEQLEWLKHRKGGVFGSLFAGLRGISRDGSPEQTAIANGILFNAIRVGALSAVEEWAERCDELIGVAELLGEAKLQSSRFAVLARAATRNVNEVAEARPGNDQGKVPSRGDLAAGCLRTLEQLYGATEELRSLLDSASQSYSFEHRE